MQTFSFGEIYSPNNIANPQNDPNFSSIDINLYSKRMLGAQSYCFVVIIDNFKAKLRDSRCNIQNFVH